MVNLKRFGVMASVLVLLSILSVPILPVLADSYGPALAYAVPYTPSSDEMPTPGATGVADTTLVGQLQGQTQDQVRISYHARTGKVRFLGTDLEHTIPAQTGLPTGATPEQAARQFLVTYGQLFGLTDQARELRVVRGKTADRGRSFVRFQQLYRGIPVLGGELIVSMDASKNVLSASGEVLPDLKLDTVPGIDAATARLQALTKVARIHSLPVDRLTVTGPDLWIYSPDLLGGPGPRPSRLVWRMEVQPREPLPIRELVLVDAQLGVVALHFNQVDLAKDREIYDNHNDPALGLPGSGPVRTEGQGPTGITDVDNAYDYAGDTYDFYDSYHGRDSIDDAGMTLISTVRYCPNASECPYANAYWNGSQMVYGDGYASADDVVAHEMTHGVTDYESNLFYYMQSGAINEAFSDIWGEFVDLTNGTGNDTAGVRWLMGEDLPVGAIRSMSNPPSHGDPDRILSIYYYCGEPDGGGVHTNSGVANKAAYLMVDGDTFNGYAVTGLGLDKTARIFYEVQTNLFTSAADYQDLYDGLYQACVNLVGTNGITASDCQAVRDATDATEMNEQPTSCSAIHAPMCDSGSPTDLFFDDLENTSSGNWTSAAIVGSDEWYYPQNAHPYSGFDATYATSGVYNIWGNDHFGRADYYLAMTSDVTLPANAYLRFNHAYAFDDYSTKIFDGGVVEYSVNGGSSWQDAGALFTHNGYNGTIGSSWNNPLGGQSALAGESNGYISSRVSLNSLVGQNVRLRFRIGTSDTSDPQRYGAGYGWFIDDLRIYTCPPPTPSTFPFCDGFESGALVDSWSTFTTNEGRVRVSSSYPYSGTYSVLLDDVSGNTTYSHAAIVLTIDLSGQSDVQLGFWWRDWDDEDNSDDGVFLSDDWGASWFTAMNFTGSQSSFKNELVDLDTMAAANGLTLNDHFQVKFQFYDNYPLISDGYAIDEVCLWSTNNPPHAPGTPSPADGVSGQDVDLDLGWTGGDPDPGDTVTYDVFFEADDPTPDQLICADEPTTGCNPGTLAYGTEYYWQVIATDDHDAETVGAIWSFKTNSLPGDPGNPSPPDGATGIMDLDRDLGWTGGDPDPGDTVTYDVFFEAGDPTPDVLICDDEPTTGCDPGTLAYGTQYYWYVRATDSHDAQTEGPIWDFKTNTPPNGPANRSPANGATGQDVDVDLSWTCSDPDPGDTLTYDVYFEAGDPTPEDLICDGVSATTCDPGPLAYGTQYYWYVRATDNHGGTATAATYAFTTVALPEAPSNLVATAVSETQIDLTWQDNSDDESEFRVERSPDGSTGWTEIDTVGTNVTVYSDTLAVCSTSYYYRVRAYRGGDGAYSGYSNVDSATAAPCGPSNLVITGVSEHEMVLAWQDNSDDETEFEIERSLDGVSAWTKFATAPANATSQSVSAMDCDGTYYHRLRACRSSDGQCSGYSNVAGGTTAPCRPTGLAVTGILETEVSLTWADNSSTETGFRIERSPDGIAGWTGVYTTGASVTTYDDAGLDCSAPHYYRVRAVRASDGAESGASNVREATTAPCRPTNLDAVSLSEVRIDLSWQDNSPDETEFRIARSDDGVNFTHIGTVGTDVTTYSDVGLLCSTTYWYRVRAYRDTGHFSRFSNVDSVATWPCHPTDLLALSVSETQIDLSWADNSPDETQFLIERSPDGAVWTEFATVPSNTVLFTDGDLGCGTTHHYRVRAFRGDVDILGAAYIPDHILWWENDGSGAYDRHFVDPGFHGARSVYAYDVDSDGDLDVLGAAYYDDEVTWWQNDGGGQFTTHVISDTFDGAYSVYAIDLDGDDDVDVLGAAYEAGDIAWWENDGAQSFVGHVVEDSFGAAAYVVATDLDLDGDVDILAAGNSVDHLAWWENDGDQNFARHTVVAGYDGARSVVADDLDGDGDLDILGAADLAADVSWFENDGDELFARHVVTDTFAGARLAHAADVDGDGDLDLLGAATGAGCLVWWENDGQESFDEHIIDGAFAGAIHFHVADVDSDGDLDVVGAGYTAEEFAWWQNDGDGGFAKHSLDTSLAGPAAVYAVDLDGDSSYSGYSNVDDATTWACNSPPHAPHDPSPPDGLGGIMDLDWDLGWTGGDPDPGDTVTYDIFFEAGDPTPDQLICDDEPTTGCDPGTLAYGTQYYWQVIATDSHSAQTEGPIWDFKTNTPPNGPTNRSPANGATGQDLDVDLSWTCSDPDPGDTVTYDVYLEAGHPTPENLICDGISATICDPGPLAYGTQYYWYVRATDNHGGTATAATYAFTTVALPAAPSNLVATTLSETQIGLSWTDNSDDESEFRVERSPDGSTGWTEIDTVGADVTVYSDTLAVCSTSYYYRVRAYRGGDGAYSGYSNVDSATAAPCGPSNLVITGVSEHEMVLAWQDNSDDETEFEIERSLDGVSAWIKFATAPANVTSQAVSAMDCDGTYYHRLRVCRSSDGQCSGYSNVVGGTTAPCRPSGLAATAASKTGIDLLWTDNSTSETECRIERSPDGSTDWVQIATVGPDTTTYSDSNLDCNTSYYYRVRAVRAGDGLASGASNVDDATTWACYRFYLPLLLREATVPAVR